MKDRFSLKRKNKERLSSMFDPPSPPCRPSSSETQTGPSSSTSLIPTASTTKKKIEISNFFDTMSPSEKAG